MFGKLVATSLLLAVTTHAQEPLLSEPSRHPDFLLPTVDGGSGQLSDHLGAKIVVFHFASW